MRLIAFGCSHTYGQGLDDCVDKNDYTLPGPNPSKFAYPALLAKKLNYDCVNQGKPGSSNKLIWYRAINFVYEKNDIVIIMWSQFARYCTFKNQSIVSDINPWDIEKISYYENFYSDYDSFIDFILRANHLHQYLNDLQIKNFHTFIEPMNQPLPLWNRVDFLDIQFYRIFGSTEKTKDGHPGKAAHVMIARNLSKKINV